MTEEQIVEAISRNYYNEDGFIQGNNVWLVDPQKLAALLVKLLPK